MAHRRTRKRPRQDLQNAQTNAATKPRDNIPKSMVIRIGAGEVGPSMSQLVKDVREMMEPHTASRLKERKRNKLRDYTTMCGPLGVTHLFLFSRSEKGNVNMRLAITPRGPTFHFRVEKYSLSKDVMKAQKHPKSGIQIHQNPPLVCPLLPYHSAWQHLTGFCEARYEQFSNARLVHRAFIECHSETSRTTLDNRLPIPLPSHLPSNYTTLLNSSRSSGKSRN